MEGHKGPYEMLLSKFDIWYNYHFKEQKSKYFAELGWLNNFYIEILTISPKYH